MAHSHAGVVKARTKLAAGALILLALFLGGGLMAMVVAVTIIVLWVFEDPAW